MDRLWKDIRYSIHSLRANPGFALVAILTLALCIGATTAIFSVVNGVLLQPLPFHDPHRLVMVWEHELSGGGGGARNFVSPANFSEWTRSSKDIFSAIGAAFDWEMSLTGYSEPELIRAGLVTSTVFDTLGARPFLGRMISGDDYTEAAEANAVLSHAFWMRKFGGDPQAIGKSVQVDGQTITIVGIMPREFFVPGSPADLWLPFVVPTQEGQNRGRYLRPIARLAPGVTLEQANARMDAIAGRLAQESPDFNKNYLANVVPVHEEVVGDVRRPLLIVMAAVACLLVIGCVNIANILLSRATSRTREMAIRGALGASRSQLIRQLLTESVVLAIIAGVLGMLLAGWATTFLGGFAPGSALLPRATEIAMDGQVLATAMGLTIATAIFFGLVPAVEASRIDLQTGLKSASRGSSHDRRSKVFRKALVTTEIGLATVLLIGAGLLIKSFAKLENVDPGVRPDHVLTMRVVLPDTYSDAEKRRVRMNEILDRVSQVPGVERVGATISMPFTNWISSTWFEIKDVPPPPKGQEPGAHIRTVTGDYFRAMGMDIVSGSLFATRESATATTEFVVNQALVDRYFDGRSPVGRRIGYQWNEALDGPIAGVVGNVRADGLGKEPEPAIYQTFRNDTNRQFTLVVRADVDPASLQVPIAQLLRSMEPLMPVTDIKPLEQLISGTIARPRFNVTILTIFATLGLLLASIGIYGVLSYSVAQRRHEMGIRMALGAQPKGVLRLVVRDGMSAALLGVVIGLAIAVPAARALAALLFGVDSTDTGVFASVAAVLLSVALVASYIPARRATRVDPMVALRPE